MKQIRYLIFILIINSLKEFVLDFDNLRKGTVTEA